MSEIVMRRRRNGVLPNPKVPGAFSWHREAPREGNPTGGRRLVYACPRYASGQSRYQWCGIPIFPNRNASNGTGWKHDGNETHPTLSPSINCTGGCGWHGFITAGRMTGV